MNCEMKIKFPPVFYIKVQPKLTFLLFKYSSLDFVKFKAGLDELESVRSHVNNSCSGVFVFWDNSSKNVHN